MSTIKKVYRKEKNMADNLFIRLVAKLNQSLSKANVQSDVTKLENTPFFIKLIGKLNKGATRAAIQRDISEICNTQSIRVNARIDRAGLRSSLNRATQELQSEAQNNPISIPVEVNNEGLQDTQANLRNVQHEQEQVADQRTGIQGLLQSYISWYRVLEQVSQGIRKVVDTSAELNKAQTDLQIVTGKSNAEMASLMGKYNELAKDLSVTTIDVASGADEWLRQGKSVAETNELIKDSVILSKVGQIDAAEATKYLTSTMNGFKAETSDVIGIVDKLTNVDLESATSAGGLAEAMSKCANSADVAGVSMDALIGYIVTVAEVTQKSDSVVGESFKTILARMGKIKLNNWIDEDGKDISGEINDVEKTLAQFDIKLRNSVTEFRNFEDVIYDVGMARDKFSSVDQKAIANAFGGVYQRENVITLFENFNRALELSEVSANSAGTAYQKFEVYENSLEAATNRLTAAFESLAYNTVSSDFIKGLAVDTAEIVEFIDKTKLMETGIKALVFTGAISGLLHLGTGLVNVRNNVVNFTAAMNLARQGSGLTAQQTNQLVAAYNRCTEAQQRLIISSRALSNEQRISILRQQGLTDAEARAQLTIMRLITAEGTAAAATFSLRGAWEALKMSIATNPIGLVITALTAGAAAISEYKQKQEDMAQSARDSAEKTDEQVKSLEKLKNKYTEICDSSDSEISKVQQLIELKNELTNTYGLTEDALHNLNLEREQGIELLEREIKLANIASRGEWLGNNVSAIKTARNKIESNQNGLTGGQTDGIIRIEDVSVDGKIDLNNIDDKIINMFKSAEHKSDNGLLFQYTEFEVAGDDMIEKYENLQEIISALGNDTDRTDEEERLLELLNNEAAAMKKVLDENRSIYETEKKMVAENLFDNYVNENSIKGLGKESYYVWRDGLLKSADGDKRIKKNLEMILAEQLPDLESYYNNLSTAKKMFAYIPKDSSASEAEYAKTTNEDRQHFLTELDDNELEIATKIPDLFSEGLEGASQKIAAWKSNPDNTIKAEVDEKSLEDIQKAYEALSKSADSFIKNQKSLKSALEEQKKHGQLSASTIRELSEAGYSEALVTDKVTGAVKLDVQAYEKLNAQKQEKIRLDLVNEKNSLEDKLRDEQSAVSDLRQEYEALAKADMEANAGRLSEITLELAKRGANIEDIRGLISQINGDITSLTAPSFENDNTDKNKEAFDKLYSQWNHDLEMNKVTQDEYINWLDGAYKQYFSDLTKYQDEYNKYEEEVYKARSDREQNLFDKKIDNLEKLADKALDDKIEIPNANKELEEFNKKMQSEYGLGNVDLTKRPKVAMDDGSTATVLSSSEFLWQGDEENGEYVAVHYTPILPDGTILDDDTLAKYLYETLEGSDDILKADTKGLVLKVDTGLGITDEDFNSLETDNPTQHIQDIIKACDDWDVTLHNIQEQWLDVSEAAENATTTATNKFDYAREQINSAIAETQARINGIKNGTVSGDNDDIEQLTDDLDSLNDKLIDINKKEIESEKDYISELKDDYSDMMNERIKAVEKLSDAIEKTYDNEINAIDKKIKAIDKEREAEDRKRKILEAQKKVKEAEKELNKAGIKKYIVLTNNGWEAQADNTDIEEAQQNLDEAKQDLEDALKDEQKAILEDQKDILEEQRDDAKDYYSAQKEALETQKEYQEDVCETLSDILDKIGGDTDQTESNRALIDNLTKSGDVNAAVSRLSETEKQKALESGLITETDGGFELNYSALDKMTGSLNTAFADSTKAINDLAATVSESNDIHKTENNAEQPTDTVTAGGFNLVAAEKTDKLTKKPVIINGEPVEGLGHKVNATTKAEHDKNKTDYQKALESGTFTGSFADYMRQQRARKKGIVPIAEATGGEAKVVAQAIQAFTRSADIPINSNIKTNQIIEPADVVQVNTQPAFNCTINIEGSADKKTISAIENKLDERFIEYTDALNKSINLAYNKQKGKR